MPLYRHGWTTTNTGLVDINNTTDRCPWIVDLKGISRSCYCVGDYHPTPSCGVLVKEIVESQAPLAQEYRPDHPYANDEGYVFLSNVNAILVPMPPMLAA